MEHGSASEGDSIKTQGQYHPGCVKRKFISLSDHKNFRNVLRERKREISVPDTVNAYFKRSQDRRNLSCKKNGSCEGPLHFATTDHVRAVRRKSKELPS